MGGEWEREVGVALERGGWVFVGTMEPGVFRACSEVDWSRVEKRGYWRCSRM